MQFSYRLYKQGSDVLLAISDSALVGEAFEEGEITLTVSKDFYAGESCNDDKAVELVKSSTIVNAVGQQIVDLLVREKFIDRASVLIVSGVPHAQIIAMNG